jgi:hypothetical protein
MNVLGRGGVDVIYKAEDSRLHGFVARTPLHPVSAWWGADFILMLMDGAEPPSMTKV